VSFKTARLAAFVLPVLFVAILLVSGGWRVHHGNVERVSHVSATAAPVPSSLTSVPQSGTPTTGQLTFVQHLSPSVPWPAWAGLVVLCLLPAVGSVLAWSGSRRGSDAAYSFSGGAS
jgi:hypothetical protein